MRSYGQINAVSNDDYKQAKNSSNFTGKVILVTGSSSGIGEGIVKLFSVLGANVVVTGRKAAEVKRVAREVQKLSPNKLKPLQVVADVTKSDDLERLLNKTITTFGKLDVLVNNAGIFKLSHVKDNANYMNVFDQTIDVNLRAYVRLSHLAVPYLEETNGTIISTSSRLSVSPTQLMMAYGVSKAGVDIMTKVLALELGPRIRVNSINPGFTKSNLNRDVDPNVLKGVVKKIMDTTPLKRLGEPLDIANGVAFLASDEANFITGANLFIDGGLMSHP